MALRINGYGENCNINFTMMFPLFHKKVKNESVKLYRTGPWAEQFGLLYFFHLCMLNSNYFRSECSQVFFLPLSKRKKGISFFALY